MLVLNERNKFPIKDKNTETQRYRCSFCGYLVNINDIENIKLTPDDDGYFDVFCPHCLEDRKMRIIKPSPWVKRINDQLTLAKGKAENMENGAFVGSYSEFQELNEQSLIEDGSIVILTTNA